MLCPGGNCADKPERCSHASRNSVRRFARAQSGESLQTAVAVGRRFTIGGAIVGGGIASTSLMTWSCNRLPCGAQGLPWRCGDGDQLVTPALQMAPSQEIDCVVKNPLLNLRVEEAYVHCHVGTFA